MVKIKNKNKIENEFHIFSRLRFGAKNLKSTVLPVNRLVRQQQLNEALEGKKQNRDEKIRKEKRRVLSNLSKVLPVCLLFVPYVFFCERCYDF
jgi:ATP-dependent Zn protease